uniref:Uncharacterized protein n=2 Tax=Spongospora subterranea TaxID=70186 RepID=A0A0H5QKF8_9EUKA|eukprot:CRZ02493.1 hypothetical protein [Spongospora subterranea]
MSPIGYWSDLQYDNTAIAHVFYSTPMTSPQLLSSIAHDPITRPALYLIAVDLKCPSSACNALDKALETLKEIHGQTESCESALDAIIVACNADSFLDDVRDYMADVMAGALRRRALSIGAGLIYCKNGQDFQTVRFHIAKHIGSFTASGAERSDGDVRDVTLSDPFLVIPIRTDTIDLIDKLTPSEYQFTDLFPEIEEDPPAQENRITAIDDDEFLEMLKNDISKSSCPDTPSHIKPSVNNRIIGSPSLSLNTPTTPSTKSQNAVKSFFESLLSPRSKDDHNQHRTRQRQAKDALLDINSNINRRA